MTTTTYIIPAPLLYQAAGLLQPPEKVCFVTGIRQTNFGKQIVILTQLVMVEARVSRVHATPSPASLFKIEQRLHDMGMEIEAQFHSHPGESKYATAQSHIDIATAQRWEKGGPFIGAIFSEHGRWVRFFNAGQPSEVIIYGNSKASSDPLLFELPAIHGEEMLSEADQLSGFLPNRPAAAPSVVGPEETPIPELPPSGGWWSGKQPRENSGSDGYIISLFPRS